MKKTPFMLIIAVLMLALTSCDDGGSETKYIYLPCGSTDDDAVNADAENLSGADFSFASGDSLISVSGDFILPSEGGCGSAFTWASGDTDTVSIADTAATVTQASTVGSGNTTVKLLATVTKGLATADREIDVTVVREKWVQDAYLKASNAGAGAYFGWPMAVSGDTFVVGANGESSSSTGVINDDGDDNDTGGAFLAGAAYVFKRSGENWTQDAYLKASNAHINDYFSMSVDIDGDTIVVGASQENNNQSSVTNDEGHPTVAESNTASALSGAVYVFEKDASGDWHQDAYLKASNNGPNDQFGNSVAVSGDTIAVAAWYEDSNATGVTNGAATAGTDGGTIDDYGAVYVFTRDGLGLWSQSAYLKASNSGAADNFGYSVTMSGDIIAVGAPFEDSNATVVTNDDGASSGTDAGSAEQYGAVYVFKRDTGTGNWSQDAYLKASNAGAGDYFGTSVDVSGTTIVVGANNESAQSTIINSVGHPTVAESNNELTSSGAAYVFRRYPDGYWYQDAYLKASNPGVGYGSFGSELGDQFGCSVGVSGGTIVVGARREDSGQSGVTNDDGVANTDDSCDESGAAYIFRKNASGDWVQDAYLKAGNAGAGDYFGWRLAIDGNIIVIGSPYEDSNARGVTNTDGTVEGTDDDSTDNYGAAYVFTVK